MCADDWEVADAWFPGGRSASGRRARDDGEEFVRVLGTQTLEQHQGGWTLTGLARCRQRGSVAPQRLDAPRFILSPEELTADEPVRKGAVHERAEPVHEFAVAAGSTFALTDVRINSSMAPSSPSVAFVR
jgi:hypothetical protein